MNEHESLLAWANGCEACSGTGGRMYHSTRTWRAWQPWREEARVGDVDTRDICDLCWGTGNRRKPGLDLRKTEFEALEDRRAASAALALLVWGRGLPMTPRSVVEKFCLMLEIVSKSSAEYAQVAGRLAQLFRLQLGTPDEIDTAEMALLQARRERIEARMVELDAAMQAKGRR